MQLLYIVQCVTLLWRSESKPACRTNISLRDNAVDESDHIEIVCSVTFNGMWTPVFVCAPGSSGTATTTITTTNQTLSWQVLHRHVIAAADIDHLQALNCSMTFTLETDYRSMFPETSIKPEYPVYDFAWNTSAIRIVNASGECDNSRSSFIGLRHFGTSRVGMAEGRYGSFRQRINAGTLCR